MHEDIKSLSVREKEVLRLLLAGHDAKSVARSLDLSVHTVNERLREARRKLGVSSSREAARRMAAGEAEVPQFFGDKKLVEPHAFPNSVGYREFGPATSPALVQVPTTEQRRAVSFTFAWLSGGIIAMWLTVTALAVALAMNGNGAAQSPVGGAPTQGQMNLMPFADTNNDGKVTPEEYKAFSEQGWGFVAQGKDEVVLASLAPSAQIAFVGVVPDAQGIITRQRYIDAIPARFKMLDRNGDGALDSDELNGRAFAP